MDGASEEETVGGYISGPPGFFPRRRREKTAISSWVVIGSVWVWICFVFVLLRWPFMALCS